MKRLRLGVGALALLAAGCESETDRAERELRMVETTKNKDEICDAHRKVAEAWLHKGDQGKYQMAVIRRDLACNEAALDRARF